MTDVVVTISFDLKCKEKCKGEYDLKKLNFSCNSIHSKRCTHLGSDCKCTVGCDDAKVAIGQLCPFWIKSRCNTNTCPCYYPGSIEEICPHVADGGDDGTGGGGNCAGGGGGGGGGGSGAWSGHECGWAYKLWTVCQIGCDTKIPSFGNNGVIKANELCPYGKCDKNRCPCFLVGPISPYCQ